MDPTTYLLHRIPGYAELDADDHKAIQEFSLLWSAFEGTVLENNAGAGRLLQLALDLKAADLINSAVFEGPLAHWRARYFPDGQPSHHWYALHMDRTTKKNQALVSSVLTGQESQPVHVLQALLLIVYRLRNNLFHGEKWA